MANNRQDAVNLSLPKSLDEAAIREVYSNLRGQLILPDDAAAYDEARTVFYGGFNRHPAAIVRAKDASDVSHVIALAREDGLELAIRSGGHSLAGHGVSEGGIVLDLSEMKHLKIDVEGRPRP
jgi:FAD/FMN-containing dehydrogenase